MSNELEIRDELRFQVEDVVKQSSNLVVTNNQNNQLAANMVKILKNFQAEIRAELRPHIQKANELHKSLCSQEKRHLEPLVVAEREIKGKMSAFFEVQEEKRRKEQQRLADQAAAAERKRRETLEKQAAAHEAAGRAEKAEERRQAAAEVHVPTPIVETAVEKQEGVATKVVWKFDIVDETLIPREFMMPDEKGILKIVAAYKNKANVEKLIPGIRAYPETIISVRK